MALITLIIGIAIGYLVATCVVISEIDEMSVRELKTLKRDITQQFDVWRDEI